MCVVYMLEGDLTVQAKGRPPSPRPSSVFFVPSQLAVTKHPETHRGSAFWWNCPEDWTGSWGGGEEPLG